MNIQRVLVDSIHVAPGDDETRMHFVVWFEVELGENPIRPYRWKVNAPAAFSPDRPHSDIVTEAFTELRHMLTSASAVEFAMLKLSA